MTEKPRVVIDTQIFLRAALNLKSLPARLIFELNTRYQLIISAQARVEAVDVLHRAKIRTRYPHLTDEIAIYIMALYDAAEMIEVDLIPEVSRDPKDDIFLATALAGKADYIVTEDQDLLVLNPYEGIRIVNVLDFLHILENLANSVE